jgi:hypothetical protein
VKNSSPGSIHAADANGKAFSKRPGGGVLFGIAPQLGIRFRGLALIWQFAQQEALVKNGSDEQGALKDSGHAGPSQSLVVVIASISAYRFQMQTKI